MSVKRVVANIAADKVDAARAFYEDVLGFERVGEVTEGPPSEGHPRRLMRHPDSGMTLGVHEPHRRSGDRFDPQIGRARV